MAKDLNKVMITGRLGADPDMRYTPQGSAVTTFRVASNRSWKDGAGQQQEQAEWVSVVTWEKLGEICNQYLRKGSRVYIEGRLQTRSWEDKDSGEKRYKTEVVATDMIMLDTRNGGDSEPEAPAPRPAARPSAPTRNVPRAIDNDEDLPF